MNDGSDFYTKLEFHKIISRIADCAATDLGRESARQVGLLPSLRDVHQALRQVSEMRSLLEADAPPPFDGVLDIRSSLQRAAIVDNTLTAQELRSIANVISASRRLKSYFSQRAEQGPLLAELAQEIAVEKVLQFNIEEAVDELGEVRDNASHDLKRIRRAISDVDEALRGRMLSILRQALTQGWAQEDLVTTRDGRLVLPVKAEHKHHVPGFIHSISASGATVFLEPAETLELNNSLRALQFDEQREIARILKALTGQVAACRETLGNAVEVLRLLDLIYAKARYSLATSGSAPTVDEKQYVRLLGARHPILVESLPLQRVIPLDLEIGEKYRTLVITGPNAGGKTVALKTVGLLCLMALAGLHIPASADSHVPFLTQFFVDIGDDQSIERDLSTFTSHLKVLRTICEKAGRSTLVLIDELVPGTDPMEGGALGASVLLWLTSREALTIVTTHNSFLKTLASSTDSLENACMQFDHANLTSTFRLQIGLPGSSYALVIAERLGLSSHLISDARNYLSNDSVRLERLLTQLEERQRALEVEATRLAQESERYHEIALSYESKVQSLKAETSTTRRRALQDAKDFFQKARLDVENIIKEIRTEHASSKAVGHARSEMRRIEAAVDEEIAAPRPKPGGEGGGVSVGDIVRLVHSDEVGEVLELVEDDQCIVVIGSMKLRASRSTLTSVKHETARQRMPHSQADVQLLGKRQIDVRGLRGAEATAVIDKFLDSAVLTGLPSIDIVHGKGTGALRRLIAQTLKDHPQVKSFHLAEWNEGGDGVTVVELK